MYIHIYMYFVYVDVCVCVYTLIIRHTARFSCAPHMRMQPRTLPGPVSLSAYDFFVLTTACFCHSRLEKCLF